MTTIRRIAVSQIDGNDANTDNENEIRPFGETAIYLDQTGPVDKPVLSIHDGIRTHLRSKVLGPGVLYGSNADAGDDSGADTIKLIPDALLYDQGSNQYIVVDPTGGEPGHIHLRAGGTQDASSADLYLGGELTCVRVSDTSGTVTVRTTNIGDPNVTLDWSFQQDGNLYFPGIGNTRIGESEPGLVVSSDASVVLQSNNNGESKEWYFGTDGSLTTPGGYIKPDATDGFLTIEGPLYADMVQEEGGGVRTITNGVKIRTHRAFDDVNHDWNFSWDGAIYAPRDASNYQVGAIEWRTGNVTSQVRRTEGGTLLSGRVIPSGLMLFSNNTGAVSVLTGNSNYWTFEADGSLTLPESSTISSAGSGGLTLGGNFDVKIVADYTDNDRTWTFNGGDGSLTFPDGTQQTTAYTGTNNATTIDITNTNGLTTVYYPTFVENRDGEEILRADVNLTYRTDDNILGVGSIGFSGGNFRVVSVPTLSTGASGDREGDMAFNSSYIYYCFADFGTAPTETFTVINVGENNNLMRVDMATNPNYTVPTAGWYVTIGGVLMTLSAFSAPSGSEYHFLFDNAAGGGGLPSTVTLTSPTGYTNIWKRLSWSGDTW